MIRTILKAWISSFFDLRILFAESCAKLAQLSAILVDGPGTNLDTSPDHNLVWGMMSGKSFFFKLKTEMS